MSISRKTSALSRPVRRGKYADLRLAKDAAAKLGIEANH
jgi:hypothetical protein